MSYRPPAVDSAVAVRMSRMPRAGTRPERELRRALHARGLRFRVNRADLPGTPDIVLSGVRVVVFVDGCYWHNCPAHGRVPKNNHAWWAEKLRRNVERDREVDEQLQAAGWLALHYWEHEPVAPVVEDIINVCGARKVRLAPSPRGGSNI